MIGPSTRPLVSWQAMSLLVGACIVAAWIFVPDNSELVDRLDKDGHLDRLKALADESSAARVTDADSMRAWLRNPSVEFREDADEIAKIKILCSLTDHPNEVGDVLLQAPARTDPQLLAGLVESLARRALGQQNPAGAGSLLSRLNALQPSWDLTQRAMQAWRWGVRSEEALKTLDAAIAAGVQPDNLTEGLAALREKLALESNQPGVAFDSALARYQASSPAEQLRQLRHLLELASAGDRPAQGATLVEHYLSCVPFHALSLDEAIESVRRNKAFSDPQARADYCEFASLYARWQEWDGHAETALNTWFRLAVLGETEAWNRCSDITEDVLRWDDFAKVLAFRIERGMNIDQEAKLAAVLLESGNVESALNHFQAAAKRAADPAPCLRSIGRIQQQAGRWTEALEAFDDLLKLSPSDLEAAKAHAFARVRLGQFDQAKDEYVTLAKAHPQDAELQETCAALCDSIGLVDEARAARMRLLAVPGREAATEDYLEVADGCRVAGDAPGEIAALRSGFERFPTSSRLRVSLAESLAATGEHAEAVSLLAHESLRGNAAAMSLLIGEAFDASNSALAGSFFNGSVPACLRDVPDAQLRMAFLMDRLQRPDAARTIVEALLHEARFRNNDIWLQLGQICLEAGDGARAESFITLYLASAGAGDSKAWETLGDIYQAQDRTEEAAIAYRKAVEVIRPTGADKPPPPKVKLSQAER